MSKLDHTHFPETRYFDVSCPVCTIGTRFTNMYKNDMFRNPKFDIDISCKMFVRVLTVHCDQNNSYEITINGF